VQSLATVPYPTRFRFKGDEITPHPYQLDCLRAADAALAVGRRMLFEMATGARTLTKLYIERPTWLDNTHRKLDAAVFAAYGWPADLSDDETLCVARLLALNLARATG
jgi:hypothetical protein